MTESNNLKFREAVVVLEKEITRIHWERESIGYEAWKALYVIRKWLKEIGIEEMVEKIAFKNMTWTLCEECGAKEFHYEGCSIDILKNGDGLTNIKGSIQ